MVSLLLGNPNNFSVLIHKIDAWNIDDSFLNGVLLFFVDGVVFPSKIVNATLKCEVRRQGDGSSVVRQAVKAVSLCCKNRLNLSPQSRIIKTM